MSLRILYNSQDPRWKRPFGTVKPGEECTMTVAVPCSCQTRQVKLILLKENGTPFREELFALLRTEAPYEYYQVRFSLTEPGLYFYYFHITTANEAFKLLKQGEDTNMEAGDWWQLSCIAQTYPVPETLKGAVFYQIFPDRFHQKGTCDCSRKLQPYWVHEDKQEHPVYLPNEQGEVLNNDFYGGNLAGIEEKLPYLASLGVEALYLNPIFMAFSSHRYDTCDYKRVDPLLGTEEDFARLCESAHGFGMKVILDGVFSHTGSRSVYFDAKHEFGGGAVSDPESPYRKWYEFQEYPHKYRCWWDFETLPCINKMEPSYMDYIFGSEDSVVAHWLRLGADGFRLDVVDELPDAFLMALRQRMRQLKPDAVLIGEVWEDASNKIAYEERRRYFTENQLDSVMNYPWRKAVLDFARGDDDGNGLRRALLDLAENYPEEVLQANLNLLSSHDVPRAITHLVDPHDGDRQELANRQMTPEQLVLGKQRFRLASCLQFALPGCPCVYYGDEAGMTGYRDPFNRKYYPWGQEDEDLRQFIGSLGRLRKDCAVLKRGDLKIVRAGGGEIVFSRTLEGKTVTIRCSQQECLWQDAPEGTALFGGLSQQCCMIQG